MSIALTGSSGALQYAVNADQVGSIVTGSAGQFARFGRIGTDTHADGTALTDVQGFRADISGSTLAAVINQLFDRASSGQVGGSDTQVQFNDDGAFGGDDGLTYDKDNDRLAGSNLTITASAGLQTDAIDVGGVLNVAGLATLNGDLDVDGSSALQSGSVTTLFGSGAAEFASTVNVAGNATLNGALDVDGISQLQSGSVTTLLGTGAAEFASTLNVGGVARFNDQVNIDGAIDAGAAMDIADNITISKLGGAGKLIISGSNGHQANPDLVGYIQFPGSDESGIMKDYKLQVSGGILKVMEV